MQFAYQNKLSFLDDTKAAKLNKRFRQEKTQAMPHDIAVSLGLELCEAYALLITLGSEGLCNNRLLIYHTCEEVHVDSIEFGQGFPPLPWRCPECEKEIETYDEMSFGMMSISKEPIEFV